VAYKDEKVIGILLEQAGAIPERCDGYREEVQHAVADVIAKERQNRYARTNIKQQVGDIVDRLGAYLHANSLNSEA
jgi:hypothetical protein